MDLVLSQGEARQKRPGLFEPKASFQGAAERALEISPIHAHAGSNTGDVYKKWFFLLSYKQRIWLFGTVAVMLVLIAAGIFLNPSAKPAKAVNVSFEMSIRDIAPTLKVTGKALARELGLPLDVSKTKPLSTLGVKPETLRHAAHHLLSHHDTKLKSDSLYFFHRACCHRKQTHLWLGLSFWRSSGIDI